jgi:hypothetical protein
MAKKKTDPERLIDVLVRQDNNRASIDRLVELTGWDETKVRRVVERGSTEFDLPLGTGPRGVIQYWGGENMSSNGLYSSVARVIENYWGRQRFALHNVKVVESAKAGSKRSGVWTHPDLVIAADPARRDSREEPRRLHAVEVEAKAGFDLRSIYQAHAQGRGAEYSWVFGDKTPGVDDKEWKRIVWTAEELGVGLVTFTKASSFETWAPIWVRPKRRNPTADEREEFIKVALGAKRIELGV